MDQQGLNDRFSLDGRVAIVTGGVVLLWILGMFAIPEGFLFRLKPQNDKMLVVQEVNFKGDN